MRRNGRRQEARCCGKTVAKENLTSHDDALAPQRTLSYFPTHLNHLSVRIERKAQARSTSANLRQRSSYAALLRRFQPHCARTSFALCAAQRSASHRSYFTSLDHARGPCGAPDSAYQACSLTPIEPSPHGRTHDGRLRRCRGHADVHELR
jgi:hypothetical protein